MAETHMVRWRAEGKALVVGEPSLYRVDIGYGEMGEPENHPLGHWIGMAASERDAEEQAMDAVWDGRLDVVCSPRIHVRKLEGEEAARELEALGSGESMGQDSDGSEKGGGAVAAADPNAASH